MAKGINKVILVGNTGADPEVRYMQNGSAVATISIATSESWKDKQTGEKQERTEWHRVVIFNKLAEIVAEYVRKGHKLYIEGSLRTRKWQDQQGQDRYTTEIVASDMQMLDAKSPHAAPAYESTYDAAPTRAHNSSPRAQAPDQVPYPEAAAHLDDDIPF